MTFIVRNFTPSGRHIPCEFIYIALIPRLKKITNYSSDGSSGSDIALDFNNAAEILFLIERPEG